MAACVVLAYAGSLSGVFLLDDFRWIVRNPDIGSLRSALASADRPLLACTFWFNHAVNGLRPAGYHAVNLAIHVGACLVGYGVLRRVLCLAWPSRMGPETARWTALAVILLWGVHPLNTSAVTYIVQRGESLMGLFYLLTLYAALRANAECGMRNAECRETGRPESRHHVAETSATSENTSSGISNSAFRIPHSAFWAALAVATCAMGMATKQVMVTAPLAVLMVDAVLVSRSPRVALRRRGTFYAGLAASWALLGVLVVLKGRGEPLGVFAWGGVGAVRCLLTEAAVIVHYLRLSVWPHPLCLDYCWHAAESLAEVWPAVCLVCGLVIGTVMLLIRRRPVGLAGGWFFLVLLPTCVLVAWPDFAFEHRMYLPLIAVICLPVVGLVALGDRVRPVLRVMLVIAAAAALGCATWRRNSDYSSETVMWQDVVRQRPDNLRARNDLAAALSEEGRIADAAAEYREVLARIPSNEVRRLQAGEPVAGPAIGIDSYRYHYFRAHANMGLMAHRELRDPEAAIGHYAEALRAIPAHPDVVAKLKRALNDTGVAADALDEAVIRAVRNVE